MFYRLTYLCSLILLCLFNTNSLSAADYFWVGGSGDWSDISHWATTDGGVTTHSQAPTANDDVFFTANSFTAGGQSVNLNTDIAFCRNLSFAGVTNNPTLIGPSSTTFTVFGSWQLDPGMTFEFDGQMVFTGNETGNTIDFSNQSAGQTITFSGGGDWTLNGTLSVDSTFNLLEGELNLNNQDLICGYFHSTGTAVRNLSLTNSEIIITESTYEPFANAFYNRWFFPMYLDATNLTIDPGNSTIDFRGNSIDAIVEGTGTIDFNRVVLSAPMGSSDFPYLRPGFSSFNYPTLNIGELELFHRTLVTGDQSIDNLILHIGQSYTFEGFRTYTLGNLEATGDCTASIDIAGTDAVNPAIFNASNPITVDYVSLRSINGTGGGAFTANNAVDLGNNPGWTINEKPTETFFWIGGTGNWNDPMHWSATSGGGPSGCVPSVTDDVFFDVNSFNGAGQTVTVNVENASCRNMSWMGVTGTPDLAGPLANRLRISGSLQFAEAMTHSFAGDYFFASSQTGNTIALNRQHLNLNTTFEGGGEWILQDSFYTEEAINLLSGTLRTNDQPINAQFFESTVEQTRGLFLGSSHITLESRNTTFFFTNMNLFTTNLTFDAGTSVIDFTGGFNGTMAMSGNSPIAFNVVRFNVSRGGWTHNLWDQTNGQPLQAAADSVIFYFNGSIDSDNNFNYLYLQAGHTYDLTSGRTQTVTELDANGDCEGGLVSLRTYLRGDSARIELPPGQVFDRLNLIDVEIVGGVPAVANNSIDGGGNYGWQINGDAGRDLYWVGGTGEWYDTGHWSLSSGGPGGECVPTALDNVFFDNNSTADPFFEIQNFATKIAYCKDISWAADIPTNVNFYVGELNCYGNFTNAADLAFGAQLKLIGIGDYSVRTGGSKLGFIEMRGTGEYTFEDNLSGDQFWHITGTVTFANEEVRLLEIRSRFGNDPKVLNLGDAHFILSQESVFFDYALFVENVSNLTINPGNSLVELTAQNAIVRVDEQVRLHDVLFSNPAGDGQLLFEDLAEDQFLTTNSVVFNGNGELALELTTDTLICAPGKSYVFAADQTQTIEKYWQIIGNNCTPISLSSSQLGTQARVSMPAEAEILADFIQMQNSTGVGGANFLAGSRSTDIANSNVNWTFETAPQFQTVGFLGEDRALCAGEDITLDAFNFSPGESYLWQDGSTDTTFVTDQSGIYAVEVTFQSNCIIRDTVEVLDALAFTVNLPDDPVICAGDSLILDADAGINSADYTWQDGSGEEIFVARTEGEYSVLVDLGGCTETDTTFLTVTQLPTVNLGMDQIACAGEDFSITADVTAESFQWQDGSMDAMFSGDQPGTYWVEATNGSCSVRDSVVISYVDAGAVNLGNDTIVCDSDQLLLDAGIAGVNYNWQDNSGDQTFEATTSGQYFVEIEVSGCTASDTINVTFPDLPMLDVVSGYEECLGTTFRLTTMTVADSYSWSNGQTGPDFSTDVAGPYTLDARIGTCTISQNFEVTFLAPPVVELGNDTVLCTAPSLELDAGQTGIWQDGSSSSTFTVTTSGQYFVDVTNGACTVSDTINVNFADQNAVDLDAEYVRCQGETFNFSSMSAADSFSWSNGQSGPDFSTDVAGPYQLEAVFGTCTVVTDFTVDFLAPPVVELGPDTAACTGTPVVLNAGQTGIWQDGTEAATFTVNTAGRYRVAVSNAGCTTEDSLEVSFLALPDFSLGDDQAACEGELLTVVVPSGLGQVRWNDDSTDLRRDFADSGIRWVDITDSNGCVARDSVSLSIAPLPVLDLGPDTTACDDVRFTLTPTAGDGLIFWPDGLTGPEFEVTEPGRIIAVIDNDGCINRDTVNVQFRECVYFQAYLPNAFSPNFDGINDDFAPGFDEELEILSYKLQVFSRWGDQLFITEDLNTPWDGNARGQLLDVGVYLYVIEVTYRDDRGMGSEVLSGDVMLLR